MKLFVQARGEARALMVAALLGAGAGLTVGGAYLGGGLAHASADHARQVRLADATQAGFSPGALTRQTDREDPSILAIAQRHDPLAVGADRRVRQASLFAARLERSPGAGIVRASMTYTGAEPYQHQGPLESSRELECLTAAVYYEARGEGEAGMSAVAQVVLNRARHPAFPASVCGVVYQGAAARVCQFSFTCDGSMRRSRDPAAWERARRIAARALGGFVMTTVGNATHFHTTGVRPGWRGLMRVSQVGTHIFYRFAGRNGASGAFRGRTPPPDVRIAEAAPAAPPVNAVADTETFLQGGGESGAQPAAPAAADAAQPAAASVPATQAAQTSAEPAAPQPAQTSAS